MAKNTITTILSRRSIRKYKPDPIPKEHLISILEAGRQAPSANNRQPWTFIIVQDPEVKKALASACDNQIWMAKANLIVAAIGWPEASPKWYKIDVSIALQNIILAATSFGYGTCWIGAFNDAKVKKILEVPSNLEVIALTPIGIPAFIPKARSRKSKENIFFKDKFGHCKD